MVYNSLQDQWQRVFLTILQTFDYGAHLKEAALKPNLEDWTRELTAAVVASCRTIGWQATAKAHRNEALPVRRQEYLSLDVMAFEVSERRWRFPIAIFELENSRNEDVVAYALWKLLCVQADLRVLFCYRETAEEGASLVGKLREGVIRAMDVGKRISVPGETMVCVGNRGHSGTFPYDFFRWWNLDMNTGFFTRM